ncbi:hypothetical protein PFISCL1PPCAC_21943, partial [Pristionchus fissidentatus]
LTITIAIGFHANVDASEIKDQIMKADQIGKEVNAICMKVIPKKGVSNSNANCIYNDGKKNTNLPIGNVQCSFLFTPKIVPTGFKAGKAVTEINNSIKKLTDKFNYDSNTVCRSADEKSMYNLPPGGIRCTFVLSRHV